MKKVMFLLLVVFCSASFGGDCEDHCLHKKKGISCVKLEDCQRQMEAQKQRCLERCKSIHKK